MAIDDIQFLKQACLCTLTNTESEIVNIKSCFLLSLGEPFDSEPLPILTPPPPADIFEMHCSFDEDIVNDPLCGWSLTTGDNGVINWQLQTGNNRSMDPNLPPFDHSTLENYGVKMFS
jgi:hypothetical protein